MLRLCFFVVSKKGKKKQGGEKWRVLLPVSLCYVKVATSWHLTVLCCAAGTKVEADITVVFEQSHCACWGPCYEHVCLAFVQYNNTKLWDKGTPPPPRPPSLYEYFSITMTWAMSFLFILLYIIKALANISASMRCSRGELRNEKCDWNRYYFLETAQMCLKKNNKKSRKKRLQIKPSLCWSWIHWE